MTGGEAAVYLIFAGWGAFALAIVWINHPDIVDGLCRRIIDWMSR